MTKTSKDYTKRILQSESMAIRKKAEYKKHILKICAENSKNYEAVAAYVRLIMSIDVHLWRIDNVRKEILIGEKYWKLNDFFDAVKAAEKVLDK